MREARAQWPGLVRTCTAQNQPPRLIEGVSPGSFMFTSNEV